MANSKHLSMDDRIKIETSLASKESFKHIARLLDKDPSTISKEIRSRRTTVKSGAIASHRPFNNCEHRYECTVSKLCSPCMINRNLKYCRSCVYCNSKCPQYKEIKCHRLLKPPYVCNGCENYVFCSLEKQLYKAADADKRYRTLLRESRTGISYTEDELKELDAIISPLVQKHQSPHHICVSNKDRLMVSESTIYRLIDSQLISAKNIDLPKKVRYRKRRKTVTVKVDKKCRIGRTYGDYNTYMEEHPDLPVVQLDSVEGKKGSSVLLTIHFVKAEMMLAFLREHNDSKSVTDIFNTLYAGLGPEKFKKIFPVLLTDNGSEFSNPSAIEFDADGNRRSMVFYCDSQASYQKGSAEHNHAFIRRFIPKGVDLALFTQNDIDLMMNHINSYSRESLGEKCPYEMFEFLYGRDLLDLFSLVTIPSQEITLDKSIFRKPL